MNEIKLQPEKTYFYWNTRVREILFRKRLKKRIWKWLLFQTVRQCLHTSGSSQYGNPARNRWTNKDKNDVILKLSLLSWFFNIGSFIVLQTTLKLSVLTIWKLFEFVLSHHYYPLYLSDTFHLNAFDWFKYAISTGFFFHYQRFLWISLWLSSLLRDFR